MTDWKRAVRAWSDVLEAIEEQGPLTRREIEYECHLTKKAALTRLDVLLEAGLVERRRSDEDGRRYEYCVA